MDPNFKNKFDTVPSKYLSYWLNKNGFRIDGADVLDFGCGVGEMALGLAVHCNAKSVHGVDIGRDFEQLPQTIEANLPDFKIPENISFEQVDVGAGLGSSRYDLICSWSVFEHINQDSYCDVLASLHRSLRPNGILIFQAAPLYYSAIGSHFYGFDLCPWAHLLYQDNILHDLIFAADKIPPNVKKHAWDCYRTLNKFTKEDLLEPLPKAGFEQIDYYETHNTEPPPERLLRIFQKDTLICEQILVVSQKRE